MFGLLKMVCVCHEIIADTNRMPVVDWEIVTCLEPSSFSVLSLGPTSAHQSLKGNSCRKKLCSNERP